MGQQPWPVPLTALEGASAGTIAWRRHGRLHLTVVVKASFAFVPGGVMTLADPEPIVRPNSSGPDDMAPFNKRIDVWVTGHAQVDPAQPKVPVRFVLYREGDMLIDNSVELGSDQPTPSDRVPLTPFGPVVRARVLDLSARRVEVPVQFQLDALQWAPLNQRIKDLVGDEWIGLSGTHPALGDFATQLPGAKAAARLYNRTAPSDPKEVPLFASALVIDADNQLCSVTWRGQTVLDNPGVMATSHVVAGVELPGRALEWCDPFATVAQTLDSAHRMSAASAPAPSPSAMPARDETGPSEKQATEYQALPFSGKKAAPPPKEALEPKKSSGTVAMASVDVQSIIGATKPTPFDSGSTVESRSDSPPPPDSEPSMDLGKMVYFVPSDELTKKASPSAEEPSAALGSTLDFVPSEVASATPFSGISAAPAPSTEEPSADLGGTVDFTPSDMSSATPFSGTAAGAPPSASAAADEPAPISDPPETPVVTPSGELRARAGAAHAIPFQYETESPVQQLVGDFDGLGTGTADLTDGAAEQPP